MKPCEHPGDEVVADINQGDAVWRGNQRFLVDYKTQWCRLCGAYRHVIDVETGRATDWRSPQNVMSAK